MFVCQWSEPKISRVRGGEQGRRSWPAPTARRMARKPRSPLPKAAGHLRVCPATAGSTALEDPLLRILDQAERTAATPCIPTRRGTTSSTLSRAQYGMSASSSGPWLIRLRPLREARNASSAVAYDARQPDGRLGRVAALVAEPAGDPAGDVAVVERERALDAGAEDRDIVPVRARRLDDRVEVEQRGDQHALAPLGCGDDRARPVRRGHGQRRCAHGSRYSRGELPRSNPSIRTPSRSPPSVTSPAVASARASSTSAAQSTRS